MGTHRISVDIDEDEHKYLKMCCAKLGMTIKEFVIGAIILQVDACDKWMLDPNRQETAKISGNTP